MPEASVFASQKTRRHIKDMPASSTQLPTEDPWVGGLDPWAKYKGSSTDTQKPTAGATAKIQEVQKQLREEVDAAVQSSLQERLSLDNATESRFQKLESNLAELRAQGQKFEHWFSDASKRMDQQTKDVGTLQQTVQSQQQELVQLQGQVAAQGDVVQQAVTTIRSDLSTQLSTQFTAQMEQFQALFAKKKREGRSRS